MNMTNKTELVIIGAGYGCHEVIPIINSLNDVENRFRVVGLLDDNPSLHGTTINSFPVLGGIKKWSDFPENVKFIFAIGSYGNRDLRRQLIHKHQIPEHRFTKLIHPDAVVMIKNDKIGQGCIIHSGVIIHSLTVVGKFNVISAGSIIGVRNILGSYSLFAAGVTTATDISFGSCSFIGAGVTVAPGLKIGCNSLIGVGSVVFRNVENGYKVLGNPAKPYGKDEVTEELINFSNKDQLELVQQQTGYCG